MNLQDEEKVVNQTRYDAHQWAHAYKHPLTKH